MEKTQVLRVSCWCSVTALPDPTAVDLDRVSKWGGRVLKFGAHARHRNR